MDRMARPATRVFALEAVGLVLLGAWALIYPQVARPVDDYILVTRPSLAGGDVAAIAWGQLEGAGALRLRLAVLDGGDVISRRDLPLAGSDAFTLVSAGPGRFVLRVDRLSSASRVDFYRLDRDRFEALPPIELT